MLTPSLLLGCFCPFWVLVAVRAQLSSAAVQPNALDLGRFRLVVFLGKMSLGETGATQDLQSR
jgi:hypothetical protein